MINDMDVIQKSGGFTGRSELVRAALRLMLDDTKEKDSLTGNVAAVVAATHKQDREESITKIQHEFQDIVKTHVHSEISRGNCVELFLLEGPGKRVATMTKAIQRGEGMKSVKLMIL